MYSLAAQCDLVNHKLALAGETSFYGEALTCESDSVASVNRCGDI